MNDTVSAALATSIAELSEVEDLPSEPFGYGRALSCTTDLTATLDEVEETSPLAITQAIIRRLITPRGALIDDADYGFDLRAYCNRGVTQDELRALNGRVRGEVLKDDRIDDVTVSLTYADQELTVEVVITPADPTLGDFTATFTVDEAAAELQSLTG